MKTKKKELMANKVLFKVGEKATFKIYYYGLKEVVTRKVESIYTHLNGEIQYNTKGLNGESGSDGYSFRNEDAFGYRK